MKIKFIDLYKEHKSFKKLLFENWDNIIYNSDFINGKELEVFQKLIKISKEQP